MVETRAVRSTIEIDNINSLKLNKLFHINIING